MNLTLIHNFHFLRPYWLLLLLPLIIAGFFNYYKTGLQGNLDKICDRHLLPDLIYSNKPRKFLQGFSYISIASVFLILAIAGPTWSFKKVPIYSLIEPYVVLLDMSLEMEAADISPTRLTRAKFVLHDIFSQKNIGQLALIAYTSEPFIVSPLTEDGETINSLLPALTTNIMPVSGNKLDLALLEADRLIEQAGFNHGSILVLTSSVPNAEALDVAAKLKTKRITTSILPINSDAVPLFFAPIAKAGGGKLFSLNNQVSLFNWMSKVRSTTYNSNNQNALVWQDRGRLFLIPVILFLIPVFRRGFLEQFK